MFDGCKEGRELERSEEKGVDQKQMVSMTLEYLLALVKVFQRTISN
jgi:hypothetical protein